MKTINARALTKAAERIYDLIGGDANMDGEKCSRCPCEENGTRYCWGPCCVTEIFKHLRRRASEEYYCEKLGDK
jgi:hypothetical protein